MMEKLRKISTMYYVRQIVACLLVYCILLAVPMQVALAEVVMTSTPGPITVTPLNGGTHQDMTAINGAIGSFSDFDIAALHSVTCAQPPNGNALFKVFGDGTEILGSFTANGNIYLIDPAGILFGPNSQINVNKLVASGLNMTDQDFLDFTNGVITKMKFQGGPGGEGTGASVTNEGTINATDSAYLVGTQVINTGTGTITSPIVVLAAGDKVYLNHSESNVYIEVASDLETPIPANNTVDNSGTINATGQVLLAAGDVYSTAISGVGKLAAVANRDIELDGAVGGFQAGEIMLEADYDSDGSGDITTTGTLTSTTGDIDISASENTIYLGASVDAADDLILNDNTEAASDITLKAGDDVYILELLTALGDLAIEATGGAIEAEAVRMDADTSLLSLTQHDSLNMEQALDDVFNSGNTDLSATSTAGSVTSRKADTWNSIAAQADTFINLNDSDSGGDITTEALTATNGDVLIESSLGKVYAQGAINAGRDVKITAKNEGPDDLDDAIFLDEDVDAGRDIWLNNNTYAYGPISLTAGQDMRLGYNENLDKYDAKTLTAEESLTIEADRHVTLGGDVTVIGSMPQTLTIKADADTVNEQQEPEPVPGGDVWAMGKLTTEGGSDNDILVYGDNIRVDGMVSSAADIEMTAFDDLTLASNVEAGGNIDLYSSDNTTYLGGDHVKATGDITLHNNTELNGGAVQRIEATTGSLYANGWVHKTNTGNLDMFGGYDESIPPYSVSTKEVRVEDGELNIKGNASIYLDGDIYSSGNMWLSANDNDGTDYVNPLYHYGGTIESRDGDVDLSAKRNWINLLGGNATNYVTAGEDILLHNYTNIVEDRKLDAGQDVVADTTLQGYGALTVEADRHITLNGLVRTGFMSAGNLVLKADAESIDNPPGDNIGNMTALANIINENGDIDIYSSDNTTILGGDLLQASGNVTLHNNTVLNGGALQTIEATTGKLTTEGYVHKTTTGNLDMFGGYNGSYVTGDNSVQTKEVRVEDGELDIAGNSSVLLGGDIYSKGRMELTSNSDADGSGGYLHHSSGTIQSLDDDVDMDAIYHSILLYGGNTTEYVTAGGDILLYRDTYIWGNRKLDADDDVVLAGGRILSTQSVGSLTIEAGDDIMLGVADVTNHWVDPTDGYAGNVKVPGDLILDAGDDIYAHGLLETSEDSGGNITVTAVDNINLYATPTSADADGTLILTADSDDGLGGDGGDLTVDGALYGNMQLSGVNVTVSGDVVSDGTLAVGADENIELRENVSSVGEMTMDAGDEIIIGEAYADDGNVTANNNIRIWAGGDWNDDVIVYGKLSTTDGGSIDVRAGDDINIYGTWNGLVYESVDADGALTMSSNTSGSGFLGGDLYIAGNTIADSMQLQAGSGGPADYSDSRVQVDGLLQTTGGNMVVRAHHDILLGGNVDSAGDLELNADSHDYHEYPNPHIYGGDVLVEGTVDAVGTIDMYGNNITLNDDVTSGGDMTLTANTSIDFKDEFPVGDVVAMGNLTSIGGSIDIYADDDTIYLGSDVTAAINVTLNANAELIKGDWIFDEDLGAWVWDGDQFITAQSGTVTAKGEVWKYTPGELTIFGGSPDLAVDLQNPGSLLNEEAAVATAGNLYIRGNGDIQIAGDITALGGFYWWDGSDYPDIPPEPQAGVVYPAEVGGVSIVSENGKIYTEDGLENDTLNVTIEGYSSQADDMGVELPLDPDRKAAIVIISKEDLKLGTGSELIAEGIYYTSTSEEFDLTGIDTWEAFDNYIDSLQYKYGSLLEEAGQGFQDYVEGLGYNIEELEEGEFALYKSLVEDYLDSIGGLELPGIDDRAAIGLLDEPAIIGGVLRDEGEPIDVAIYVASTDGDVDVSGSVSIESYDMILDGYSNGNGGYLEPRPEFEPQGTMVIDAYDTVTLGDFGAPEAGIWNLYGFASLEDLLYVLGYDTVDDLLEEFSQFDTLEDYLMEYWGEPEGPPVEPEGRVFDVDRLEVVSRITEWLFQAINFGRLPFVGDPAAIAAFEDFIGGDYILRGAGLENPVITDGRAWVLENPLPPAPLYQEAGEALEPLTLGVEGCPVLVAAVSSELGIPGDTIQVSLANSFALNTNIQPCESCARLLNAATILRDEDGSGMAALNQVFNTVAPAGAPFTPEMATSIATAFAGRVNDGTQYATAIEYIDAFVRYLAVLDTEMGSPVADGDSIAFLMGKYGTGITESDNSNIAAFVATRLESGETFGE